MKVIIVVHSNTGTTKRFADRIASQLKADGHAVDVVQLETDVPITSGSVRRCDKFVITNLPDIRGYDAVLPGGPVWGFAASPVIMAGIDALADLKGKKVLPFVTQGFPFKFLGGNQAVKMMARRAAGKNAAVLAGVIAPKLFHDMDREMARGAVMISAALKAT